MGRGQNRIWVGVAALTFVAAGVTAACSGFSSEDSSASMDDASNGDGATTIAEAGDALTDAGVSDAAPLSQTEGGYSEHGAAFTCLNPYDGPAGGMRLACRDFDDEFISMMPWSGIGNGALFTLTADASVSPPNSAEIFFATPEGGGVPESHTELYTLSAGSPILLGHWLLRARIRQPEPSVTSPAMTVLSYRTGNVTRASVILVPSFPNAAWKLTLPGVGDRGTLYLNDDRFADLTFDIRTFRSDVDGGDGGPGGTAHVILTIAGIGSTEGDFSFDPSSKLSSAIGYGAEISSNRTKGGLIYFDNVTLDQIP